MSTFWDGCVLIKYSHNAGPTIIKQYPEKLEISKQRKSFLACAFPETQEKDSVFTFSINKHLCFSMLLTRDNELYAIVILSHHCFPHLFVEFLKSCKKTFTIDQPEEILDAITVFLSQWKYDSATTQISVVYPTINFSTLLDATHTFFMQYDPSVLISTDIKVLYDIWKAIIIGSGILFIGETAEQVSSAIFSALSLITPLRYADHLLIYTRFGDQRFAEIIEGSKKWKIVGTTNALAAERCKQFHTVIHLESKNVPTQPELRQEIQRQTNKIIKRVESQLNKAVETDPYYDLLETPLPYPQITEVVSKTKLDEDDFKSFQKTQTFKSWRKGIALRIQFRESMLSFSPEQVVENRPDDELDKISTILKGIPQKMPGDNHMKAVINQHLKLIKKRLDDAKFPAKI